MVVGAECKKLEVDALPTRIVKLRTRYAACQNTPRYIVGILSVIRKQSFNTEVAAKLVASEEESREVFGHVDLAEACPFYLTKVAINIHSSCNGTVVSVCTMTSHLSQRTVQLKLHLFTISHFRRETACQDPECRGELWPS